MGLFSNRTKKVSESNQEENITKPETKNVKAIRGYDDLLEAKRTTSNTIKIAVGLCIFFVIAMLFLVISMHISTLDAVKVVDQNGNVLGSKLDKQENLLTARVETHCANTINYLNSFDRLTIKENQARALFLVNAEDANRVFGQFNSQNSYGDALTRGVVFTTKYDKILGVDLKQEPYRVRFQSVMTVYDNEQPPQHWLVVSEGELSNFTAQYPENAVGLYFKKYKQEFKKLETDE